MSGTGRGRVRVCETVTETGTGREGPRRWSSQSVHDTQKYQITRYQYKSAKDEKPREVAKQLRRHGPSMRSTAVERPWSASQMKTCHV